MISDVFFADQICYLNEINRSHAVCFGLLNAKKMFERTFWFRYRSHLEQEANSISAARAAGKNITDPDFPHPSYQLALLQERTIDCFLIGTFFEIVAKSFLLDRGFIVHELRRNNRDGNIRRLAQHQSRTPVRIADLLRHDHFQDFKGNGRNGLESLLQKTVDYGCLYQHAYERELGFDPAFCRLGRYYRIERNMIHFPLAGASENQIENPESANVAGLDHMGVITEFIVRSLVPLFERRRQQYNFSFPSIS